MKRMIPIVDLKTGAITDLPSDTPTLDLPQDFDRGAPSVELHGQSRVQYLSMTGKTVSREVFPRPLSWRVHGEDCLVRDPGSEGPVPGWRVYTLSSVE
jgi:hypothetical protein